MVAKNKIYLFLVLLTLSSSLHTMDELAHLQAGHIQHFTPIGRWENEKTLKQRAQSLGEAIYMDGIMAPWLILHKEE